jgi:asparagine synthase (glutamine-hydrolysing)
MCGIIGLYDNSGVNHHLFNEQVKTIQHRGPDHQASKKLSNKLFFGHTRLSIIDLKKSSNQPFSIDGYTLTFNGEIYNYIEIKKKLERKGIVFITNSDTEVLLRSYIFWGPKCVNLFNGMWAFSIHDPINKIIFSSRDRYGIKPFYFYPGKDQFMFSSMISPILNYFPFLKKPNFKMIDEFLYRGYIGQFEETWFCNIKKLRPGHNLIYDFKSYNIYRFYNTNHTSKKINFSNAKIKFLKLFENSITLRMRSDVKIASTLTSGLDSSSIVSIINKKFKGKKLRTYTVFSKHNSFTSLDKSDFSFNVNLDESNTLKNFKNYSLDNVLIEFNSKDFLEKLKTCIKYIESGHASPAIVGVYDLYKNVKKDKVKVLIEGQGADEVFGGYISELVPEIFKHNFYNIFYLLNSYLKLKKIYSIKMIILRFLNRFKKYKFFSKLKIKYTRNLVTKNPKFKSINYKNIFDYYQRETLSNLLLYGDSLSMANSVETRFPFLDYNLVDFANILPFNFKVKKDKGKYIIREAMKEYIPKNIYNSKVKNGFGTPIDNILKNSIEIKRILYDNIDYGYFENKKLNSVLDRYYNNKSSNHYFIFKVLTIKIWFDIYFKKST